MLWPNVILDQQSPFVICICKRRMPTFPCVPSCHDVEKSKILCHFTQIFCCCNLFLDCPSSYLHPFVLANFFMILLGFFDLSSSYLLLCMWFYRTTCIWFAPIIILLVCAHDFTRLLACEFAPTYEQICKLWKTIAKFYESIIVELLCDEARE